MNATEIVQKVEALEPGMQQAYLDSVRATVSAAKAAEVEQLLAQDDEDGLVELLSLGALALLVESIRAAYMSGARYELIAIVIPAADKPIVGRKEFDVTRPAASAWIERQAQALRSTSQIDVRAAIREVMASRRVIAGPVGQSAAGEAQVRTNRQAALDLLGRVSPQTGSRTGGVIGLPGNMARYVTNARTQLLSGDPELMKQYLSRIKRDRRYDGIVERAIKAGQPVDKKIVEKIAGRYAERLLKFHAEMIAQTSAHESFSAGRERAWEQLVEQGLDRNRIEKEWRDRADEKVRNSHRSMRGQRVLLGAAFTTGAGALLRFPGDQSLGAGWNETANCRCICIYHLRK